MSTDTLVPTSHLFAISEGAPEVTQTERNTSIVRGLKVFRTGTFKDSRGKQKTWTIDDLHKIAENFRALQPVFPNPPVRADHGTSVDKVKGFVTDVRVEGEFLVNDIEFTEPDGAEKYTRKTYRNRSIEVGPYETNGATPATLWPTQLGVAFVDVPAVEGLGFRRESTEEIPVSDPITFRIRGVETANIPDVQAYIAELEKRPETGSVASFRIGGEETQDFTRVQAHIATLETFRTEQLAAGRDAFVDKLVADKKVGAPQTDELKAFAKCLDDSAFATWSKTFEKAPAIFTKQTGDGDGSTDNNGGTDPAVQAIADLRDTVAAHRMSGMESDAIKATESYRKLVAVSPSDAIA